MKRPLHERIRSDFETRILSGELVPGDRLPTEQDLMQDYGCSRMTVNKALSALAATGLIDRRKRAGTSVARPRVHSMVLDVPDLAEKVRERGQSYDYVLLRRLVRKPVSGDERERLLAGGGALLEIDGLHRADKAPFALEHRLVSLQAVPDIVDVSFEAVAPGTWLLDHVPWTEAENRIAAVAAEAADARQLGLKEGEPCLSVERRTWRGREGITLVRQLFPGHLYDLVAHFGPGATPA